MQVDTKNDDFFARSIQIGKRWVGKESFHAVHVGRGHPLAIICGPCVIESRDHLMHEASRITDIAARVGVGLIFKSSYDKANRTSLSGFRGVGMEQGLRLLEEVRLEFGVPVVTDVHSPEEAKQAAPFVDMLQVPAFLCRQTDLLQAVASQGLPVMVKKGQFLAPEDMKFVAEKIVASGNNEVLACERGACFGYRELVVDFRSLEKMRELGLITVFDATHSVQVMGGAGGRSTGNRQYVPALARAAVAVGVDLVFLESHSRPDQAPSDGPNMIPISELSPLLYDLKAIGELNLNRQIR